jgi:gas vesicle protein
MASRHDQNEVPTFVLGMILGFIAGSIAALWMAPRSGAAVREDLRQRVRIVLERVQGESVEETIELGKAIAHQKKADAAQLTALDDIN